MTTAEKYRQLEKSPVANIARFIFNDLKMNSINTTLENVISDIKTGKTPSKQQKRFYEDDYFDWFKPDEIGSEKYLFTAKDKVSKHAYETKQATIFESDTILINAIGDVGRISILKRQASSNQQITGIRLKDDVYIDYAYFYLLAHRKYFYVDLFQTTLPIVNQKKINSIPFCYPNIEEQKRIVKGFEAIENIKSIDDLHIIDKLNWKDEYKTICRNFFNLQFGTKEIVNELNYQLELIKQLRQSFLCEAMQGKLIKSVRKDETGQQLLAKIKGEKAQLIVEKKLKKEKELPAITANELPFELPEHWIWCRLGEILKEVKYGTSVSCDYDKNKNSAVLRIPNVSNGEINIQDLKYANLSEKEIIDLSLEENDILIVRSNGSKELVGKTVLVKKEYVGFCYAGYLIRLRYNSELISPNFLLLVSKSPFFRKMIESPLRTTVGINNINSVEISLLRIPLPPLHEQEQIVAKLEELMTFCNGLEESIKESQIYNDMLLQQALKEALQPKEKIKTIYIESRKIENPLKTILAGHIINLNNTNDFGRVKFQKLLFLTEYICKIDFDSNYIKKVAGPYDDVLIKSIESDFNRMRFFNVVQDKTDNKRVRYTALAGAKELESLFLENFPNESLRINNTLLKFRPLSWGECELIATLYAVWNNRIIKNETITDELLYSDFMAWDKQKSKYHSIFHKWLFWMKDERIIPDGWGKYIDKPQ